MTTNKKVALVTGGGTGIGKAIALEFAKEGYDVALTYVSSDAGAKEAVSQIEEMGQKAVALKCNISKCDEIENLFAEFSKHFDRLDVLVNNAGVTKKSAFLETDEALFDLMCDVDLKGSFFCTQGAAKLMIEKGIAGSIVMISSNHSKTHFGEVSVYGTVKAAVNKLAEHCAIELAKYKIRVNTIAPGWTDTGSARLDDKEDTYYKIPLCKWATCEEVAKAAIYLSSPAAASVTGATLVMDNGASLVCDKRERYGF
ncbi:MAG: SDR family oxidoreductase [Oscillospiraceae bacterium]|nr:SDR family oxidoreductase [Oscillospiraceae bacterium]